MATTKRLFAVRLDWWGESIMIVVEAEDREAALAKVERPENRADGARIPDDFWQAALERMVEVSNARQLG